jgi:sugar O-acyltransferase (sialic acid O-acetyltransferase NeuD family)
MFRMIGTPSTGINTFATAFAELLRDEGDLEPVAFTVHRDFAVGPEHAGLPLVPTDELVERFPPSHNRALVPLGFRRMMSFRAEMCELLEGFGYSLTPWISRRANVWSRLEPGPNSIIMPGATVLPYARLGRDVAVRPNVMVSHHCELADHVTLANGVVLGGGSSIGANSWVGLGAVIRDQVTIARRTFVGAGAVVTADTEEDGIYIGVPARRTPGKTATEFAK